MTVAMMEWQDSFSVGITAMDIQHKQLVAMVNQLYEAMRTSKGDVVVKTILPSLVQYTKSHFASEEKVMKDAGFPGLAAHQAIHQQLTKQATDLLEKIKTGKMVPTVSLASFLKDWLINHIQGQDKQYGKHIAGLQTSLAR
jgi:hemerythrin